MSKELEILFHKDMLNIYTNAKNIGYNASRFKQMVANEGGLTVARKFITNNTPSEGFTSLWELKRLDLTVEALILKEKYQYLFSEYERKKVFERLLEYGYEPYTPTKISGSSIFDYRLFNSDLISKKYIIGLETKYYIITVKVEPLWDSQSINYKYMVYIVEDNIVVKQREVESNLSKSILTEAKRIGVSLLSQINPTVRIEDVTLVNYKQDRPNANPWQKDSLDVLNDLFVEYENSESKWLDISNHDIDSELYEEEEYHLDGASIYYYGKRYERNPFNRAKALEIHGLNCFVCKFNFEKTYGERGKDFIEVHHVNPLSTIKEDVIINPKTDLVPVCSNCHRMIHRKKDEVLSIEQMKAILKL
ncbi:HNH endonuclease [Gottfriedia sp. OAE603]|uniref:HNH endonuclease n=1 Tax=Gottfriedia sp. OAE603 TaxID=2663872 RepID=UPI00178AE20D